jgi:8-oxo-dGTP diphosphatase
VAPVTVYLARHGKAGDRKKWVGPDELRPLSRAGRRQADALVDQFAGEPIEQVISSPYVRCVQTVEPLARALDLEVDVADELSEGARYSQFFRLLEKCAHRPTVLCTHGDLMGALLEHLGRRGALREEPLMPKGSTWLLEFDGSDITSARYVPPPR